ncbi:putative membrane protein YedE/YeeE [Providencia alcalifaciens]|nr:putative membrane protein YedE/YeeE [Providencia alcalifaciens]
MPIITALISGLLFGIGLILAGMSNPSKILGFLDITGRWDPSLLITMAMAMGVSAIAFKLIKKHQVSVLNCRMQIPINQKIDQPLIIGSILFGIGWGLAGICPGPALLLTGMGITQGVLFTLAMIAGMSIFQIVKK